MVPEQVPAVERALGPCLDRSVEVAGHAAAEEVLRRVLSRREPERFLHRRRTGTGPGIFMREVMVPVEIVQPCPGQAIRATIVCHRRPSVPFTERVDVIQRLPDIVGRAIMACPVFPTAGAVEEKADNPPEHAEHAIGRVLSGEWN